MNKPFNLLVSKFVICVFGGDDAYDDAVADGETNTKKKEKHSITWTVSCVISIYHVNCGRGAR